MKIILSLILLLGMVGCGDLNIHGKEDKKNKPEGEAPSYSLHPLVGGWTTSLTETPPFKWQAIPQASSYEIAIGTSASIQDILPWTDVGLTTSTLGNALTLTTGGEYYYHVRAKDASGNILVQESSSAWTVLQADVFSPRVGYAVPVNGTNNSRDVATGDINGDEIPDMVAVGVNARLSYYIGVGDGTFINRTDFTLTSAGQTVAVRDIDNDGDLDVLVNAEYSYYIALNTAGALSLTSYPTGSGEMSAELGDFDSDGFLDVVTAAASQHGVALLLNHGTSFPGQLFSRTLSPLTSDTAVNPARAKDIDVADLDGDDKLDAIVALETNSGANAFGLMVLLGDGSGSFAPPLLTSVTGGLSLTEFTLGDIDGDSILDVIVTSKGNASLKVLKGNGDGSFTNLYSISVGTEPYDVKLVDMNGDEHLDVVVANSMSHTIGLFLGRGDGTFMSGVTYPTGAFPVRIEVADMTGDGKKDIIIAEKSSNEIGVLIQR